MAAVADQLSPPSINIPLPDAQSVTELPEPDFPEKYNKLGEQSGVGSVLPGLKRLTPPKMDYSEPNHRTLNPFFARHNPHPHNVHHIKGLLDLPICMVENLESGRPASAIGIGSGGNTSGEAGVAGKFPPNHFVQSRIKERHNQVQQQSLHQYAHALNKLPVTAINLVGPRSGLIPNDTINGLQYFTGLQNYSFKDKAALFDNSTSATVDCQQPWRLELEQLANAAFHPILAAAELEQQQKQKQQSGRMQHPGEWMMGNSGTANVSSSPARKLYSASSGRLLVSTNQKRPVHTPGGSVAVCQTSRPTESRSGWLTPKLSTNTQANLVRSSSQSGLEEDSRRGFNHIYQSNQTKEIQVFQMLCGILQTQDEKSVQSWLLNASDREKNLVLDILQSALKNREEYYNLHGEECLTELPQTAISQRNLNPIDECEAQNEHPVDRLVVHGEDSLPKIPNNVYNNNGEDQTTKLKPANNQEAMRPPTSSTFRPNSSSAIKQNNKISSRPSTSGNNQVWNQNDSLAK